MGVTRIAAVTPQQAGPMTKLLYRLAKRRFREVPEPFAVTANHPKLLTANAVHETMVDTASSALPAVIREIAVYRTAWKFSPVSVCG